ncbi:hypothetical protein NERG_02607 [Nematocida ausubeli]|uniref:Uncharacterized protein n=1 Tax=Nematocida ausubeli (strain ATCC PRA-371 / ERTm2) TaxID=1913371 RepID=H8ZG86_NEMA1|nr:hypothetical protein NERG_02607 [Nematocida ausubeli]
MYTARVLLIYRVLGLLVVSVSVCSFSLIFFVFSCVCTENTLLFYYFYYSGYTAVMHTHCACTRVSLINSLIHSPILSCLALWPFCSSFYHFVHTCKYHLISLGTLCILPVFSLYTHSWALLIFSVSDHTFSLLFSFILLVYIHREYFNILIFYFYYSGYTAVILCVYTCLSYILALILAYTLSIL